MAEQIDLTTPAGTTTALWRIKTIILDLGGLTSNASVFSNDVTKSAMRVVLLGLNNQTFPYQWTGTGIDADMKAFNTMNLTTISLHKRIFNKLIADAVAPGTVSGAPDA